MHDRVEYLRRNILAGYQLLAMGVDKQPMMDEMGRELAELEQALQRCPGDPSLRSESV